MLLVYAIKRLLLSMAITVLAIVALFAMIYVVPGDPAKVALGPRASPAVVAAFRERMGLDLPLYKQLGRYFSQIAAGDLGTDVISARSVTAIVAQEMPHTLALIAASMLWSILLGLPLGCHAALHRGSISDSILGALSVATITVPPFVVAIFSLIVFSVWLGWFPVIGAGEPGDILDQAWHLVLPAFALGLGWVGYVARLVRASLLEVLSETHIRLARAFGLPRAMILTQYALRIAVLPLITVLGIGIGGLLTGAVFAEIVFTRPGIGKLVYDAIITRNYPVVTGTILVTTVFYILVNLVTDLISAGLDPRVRQNLAN